ncbi:MAG: GTP 3',8-cyclase MoaA [Desulfobacterales bacterium]|nr:GTP 3',8-cyclase MoaA [Desulfobacterales bacterium]MBS3755649.1 GTP 3',8-cyclase MoaA [Desulfobacterales bacterium]
MQNSLIDTYKRHINYLRISITDRCNLRCIYCAPGMPIKKMPHESILRYEEILRLVRIGARLGITKVRVTGGEPLVRKGCCDFLEKLTRIRQLADISLTTNGVLLKRHLPRLYEIGIRRLNISMDTRSPEKYKKITGIPAFDRVWGSIHTAMEMGFSPIKLNVVALNGINDNELADLARLTFSYPLHVRFIEQMPFGNQPPETRQPLLAPDIRSRIESIAPLFPVSREANDGPARRYRFSAAPGEIGFIAAVSQHFCEQCNRLRLTADGRLRPCLLSDQSLDIKTALRNGAADDTLAGIFLSAVASKPRKHGLRCGCTPPSGQMGAIGG